MLLVGGVVFLAAAYPQTLIVVAELVYVTIQNAGIQLCAGVVHYGKRGNGRGYNLC